MIVKTNTCKHTQSIQFLKLISLALQWIQRWWDGLFKGNGPLTTKIWLSILPSSFNTFPSKLITRTWCSIKVTNCTWWVCVFSLPVCCTTYGYYREYLHDNHLWEWKGLTEGEKESVLNQTNWTCVSCLVRSKSMECFRENYRIEP